MYRLDPKSHLPFLNLFFETEKERVPEFITPLGSIIYSEKNALDHRVYFIIRISSWQMGVDFTAEASVFAINENTFKPYLDDASRIWKYHHNYLGGNTVEYLRQELGPLAENEIYFVENNYSSFPEPLEHVFKLDVEKYIADLSAYFQQNPLTADRLYDLGNYSKADDLEILKLYNGRYSTTTSCINLRAFSSYGYGDPRTSFSENTWFNKDFAVLKDLNALSLRNNKSLLPEALEIIQDFPYLVELSLADNQLEKAPPGLQNLRYLKRLNFNHNNFAFMDDFLEFTQIKELSLKDNAISAIPGKITALESLEHLDLSANKITELSLN